VGVGVGWGGSGGWGWGWGWGGGDRGGGGWGKGSGEAHGRAAGCAWNGFSGGRKRRAPRRRQAARAAVPSCGRAAAGGGAPRARLKSRKTDARAPLAATCTMLVTESMSWDGAGKGWRVGRPGASQNDGHDNQAEAGKRGVCPAKRPAAAPPHVPLVARQRRHRPVQLGRGQRASSSGGGRMSRGRQRWGACLMKWIPHPLVQSGVLAAPRPFHPAQNPRSRCRRSARCPTRS
jgi:hypothetical protein